jgi:hypothetical protein
MPAIRFGVEKMHKELIKNLKKFIAADTARFEKERHKLKQKDLAFLVQSISTRKAILHALENNRIARNDADIEGMN